MQNKSDPQHYLQRNFYNNYSSYGTPFLDSRCNLESTNLIIYGHHIRNSSMFGGLEKYKNYNFYKSHNQIKLYMLSKENQTIEITYEIFAVLKTTADSKQGIKYYSFVNNKSKQAYNNFINDSKQLSLYQTEITPQYAEQLLTLSTCEYSSKNGRLIIIAKKYK